MGRAQIIFTKEELEESLGIKGEITGIYRDEATDGIKINIKGQKLPEVDSPYSQPEFFSLEQIHAMEKEAD